MTTTPGSPFSGEAIRGASRISALAALGKPRIALMVSVSALAGAVAGGASRADLWTLVFTVMGIGLTSYAAAALNNVFDLEIDRKMFRTRHRPLVAGAVSRSEAIAAGIFLGSLGILTLAFLVNALTSALAAATLALYLLVYTPLKRRTPFANEVGGVAGAMPPVLGWTAVAGSVAVEPLLLFLVVLFWQPPHFWALASHYREDYLRAGVPVLPVVASHRAVYFRGLVYTILLLIASVLPYVVGVSGPFYLVAALLLGAVFLMMVWTTGRSASPRHMRVFGFSLIYLSLFWVVYLLDRGARILE